MLPPAFPESRVSRELFPRRSLANLSDTEPLGLRVPPRGPGAVTVQLQHIKSNVGSHADKCSKWRNEETCGHPLVAPSSGTYLENSLDGEESSKFQICYG